MGIIAWVGPLGSGKTGGMTWRLMQQKKLGRKVMTNYEVSFEDGNITSEILERMPEDLKNVAMGVDEIHVILDSRTPGKSRQRKITYFVLQTRKRKTELNYATQDMDQVDVRLRRHTDLIIKCKNLGCNDVDCRNKACGIPTCGIFMYRVYKGPSMRYLGRFFLDGTKSFYQLYDTEQVVIDITQS